jgi:tRNA A37 threonylcarbamoyladenosine synthetase subunit TsaC/SUA5/YrdC
VGSDRRTTGRSRVEVAGERPPPIFRGSAPSTVKRIVGAIRQGAVVAIPTDTVYGIAAALDKPEALDRVFDIKGRPRGKPLPVLVSAVSHIGAVSVGFDERTLALAARFWPGALTIVVPARPICLLRSWDLTPTAIPPLASGSPLTKRRSRSSTDVEVPLR